MVLVAGPTLVLAGGVQMARVDGARVPESQLDDDLSRLLVDALDRVQLADPLGEEVRIYPLQGRQDVALVQGP